jgi:hypothetical protein
MRTYEVVSADSHLEVPPDLWRSYVDKGPGVRAHRDPAARRQRRRGRCPVAP